MGRLALTALLAISSTTGAVAAETTTGHPEVAAAPSGAIALSEGGNHVCGIHADGTLSCWGDNFRGEAVPPDGTFVAVDAGSERTCGVRTAGAIECWGEPFVPTGPPAGAFVDVAVGEGYACAIRSNGRIACWGTSPENHPVTDAPGGNTFVEISSEFDHTCARRSDGSVACWGNEFAGGLDAPTGVFARIAAGRNANCGVLVDGRLRCWGFDLPPSVNDAPSGRYTRVSRSSSVACAIAATGEVVCWGDNGAGQLNTPPGRFVDVAVGNNHACAIDGPGRVVCWGDRYAGLPPQAGYRSADVGGLGVCPERPDGTRECLGTFAPEPVDPSTVRQLVTGGQFSCIVTVADELDCWGTGFLPGPDLPPGAIAEVGLGGGFACGRRPAGTIVCWGDEAPSPPPGSFDSLAVGGAGVCGIRADGTLGCRNRDTPFPPERLPTPPAGTFETVAVGDLDACAVRPDGTVACWSAPFGSGVSAPAGTFGELSAGDSTFCGIRLADDRVECWDREPSPATMNIPDAAFSTLSAGSGIACGLRSGDGVIQCWGDYAILGEPFSAPIFRPVPSFTAVPPLRVLDSRPGESTFDGRLEGFGPFNADSVVRLFLRQSEAQARAVALSVTITQPQAPGFATLWPCFEDRPEASSVNWLAGQTVTNTVLVRTSAEEASVCVYTSAQTHVVIDEIGYVPPGATVSARVPARLADSRPGEPTVDGRFAGVGRLAAGETLEVETWGRGGVLDGATAALLNVVAVEPAEPGFLSIFACDEPRPAASNVNYLGGGVTVNMAFAPLDPAGRVCIFSTAATDLVVDATGSVPSYSGVESVSPARLADSRPGEPTVDGSFAGAGRLGAFEVTEVEVTGRAGVPDDAVTVLLNAAVVDPDDVGFLTVFPCGTDVPLASAMNYVAGDVRAVAVPARVGRNGAVCFLSRAATDLVVDVSGFVRG